MPKLKVMEIENLVERRCEGISQEEHKDELLEIEDDGAGSTRKSRKNPPGIGQLTEIWKKLRVRVGKKDR